nr:DDRGK domain-containing protein 1-like [Nicotiana tomentosiformis]
MDLVKHVDSHFPIPIAASGPRSSDPGSLLPSATEKTVTRDAPVAAASQPSMPTTSRPSTPTAPSPPAPTASPPPSTPGGACELPESDGFGEIEEENMLPFGGVLLEPRHAHHEANFIASEGLQKLILDKQGIASQRDQLLVKRDQLATRLPVSEAKDAEHQEAKSKWAELQDTVLAAVERELASEGQIKKLKAELTSKTEKDNATEEKRAKMEERFKKIMKQNRIHLSTTMKHDSCLGAMRSERDNL